MIAVLKDVLRCGSRVARISLICAVGLALVSAGCRGAGDTSSRPDVVAAFYPLAFLAEQVLGEEGTVRNLTPAGAEPHDLELSPRDVADVRAAGTVLYLGGGFMPALERALEGRRGASVDVLAGVRLRRDGDPHVWLDPRAFADMARRVGRDLGRPARGADLARRLLALDADFARGLAACDRHELVTSHAAFGYLADRYGLEQLALVGIAPETEPSAREVAALVRRVRATGATTVFTEPLVSPRLADTVAREAGIRTATLDPIEGLSQERLAAGADYVSVMRQNLASLRTALGCR
jgi:zinc transport system substrate-binding protein